MPPIQFSHANGFPARSYQYLFDQLSPYQVEYIPVMGTGSYQIKHSWEPLVTELITTIEKKHTQPVVGVGHSLGGVVTFKAARKRPDLFKQIILLDPPLFGWSKRMLISLVRMFGFAHKAIPIVKQARVRRTQFGSREEAFDYWKPKRLFQHFHPACFQDYVQYGLQPVNDGFTLTIPREQEALFFQTTPSRIGSTALSIPSYYIYPTQSVLSASEISAQKRVFSRTEFLKFEGGHMFPLEKPEEVASLIKQLIQKKEQADAVA